MVLAEAPGIFEPGLYGHPKVMDGTVLQKALFGIRDATESIDSQLIELGNRVLPIAKMDRNQNPVVYDELMALPEEQRDFRDNLLLPVLYHAMEYGIKLGTHISFEDIADANDTDGHPAAEKRRQVLAEYADGTYRDKIEYKIGIATQSMQSGLILSNLAREYQWKEEGEYRPDANIAVKSFLTNEVGNIASPDITSPLSLTNFLNANDPETIRQIFESSQEVCKKYGNNFVGDSIDIVDVMNAIQRGLTIQVARRVTAAILAGGLNPKYAARINPQSSGHCGPA